jgi:hypothetical protein
MWVPLAVFMPATCPTDPTSALPPAVFNWCLNESDAACLRDANAVRFFKKICREYRVWWPLVAYHGTALAHTLSITQDGLRASSPHMLGRGVYCGDLHKAARFARADTRYRPHSRGGIWMVLAFPTRPLLDMHTNTVACVSEQQREEETSTVKAVAWRAARSRYFVDHCTSWELRGFDGAVLPPTCLGELDGTEHWLVRNGEVVFREGIVLPVGLAEVCLPTLGGTGASHDPERRSALMC